ncbi:hypothetical protein LOK49_LG10G02985 [Camellia lanceoleosa]|uniref:Uncharacterized protein n=1 Tax=Camellia lanceoleosa TaxID=1840588 RepID=A0ACC0GEV6_9ERIC|nr:hypothetical protein LOK49_LG10G02985 [Camellia lanceoleosa]
MKASIKFREERNPLFRAKVPLNILGLPFQSGIVAGESKELSLNLGTFFDSGPSLKIAYRPNDSQNPFNLVFKTGIGHFGSPISSPMTMSAEFNLIGNQNPSFFIHFKPQFGDFCIKKSQSSDFVVKSINSKPNVSISDDDSSMEVIETPVKNPMFSGKRITVLTSESPAASLIGGLLSGMEASAKTVVPVMNRAVVNFRWGFRFPVAEEAAARNPTAAISIQKLPLLVMNKIGIEPMTEDDSKDSIKVSPGLNLQGDDFVVETCSAVKRQLELIQVENGMLRKAMDDLRSEFSTGKSNFSAASGGVELGKYRADRRSNGDKISSESNGFGGKVAEGDVNDGLKKAATGGA